MRHPLRIDANQPAHALDHGVLVECGQARTVCGQIHAVHIHIRPEHADASVDAAVRFHALEQFDGVVQHLGGRMNDEILHGCDFRALPAAQVAMPRHLHHVIGEDLAEAQIVGVRFRLQLMRLGESDTQIIGLCDKLSECLLFCIREVAVSNERTQQFMVTTLKMCIFITNERDNDAQSDIFVQLIVNNHG